MARRALITSAKTQKSPIPTSSTPTTSTTSASGSPTCRYAPSPSGNQPMDSAATSARNCVSSALVFLSIVNAPPQCTATPERWCPTSGIIHPGHICTDHSPRWYWANRMPSHWRSGWAASTSAAGSPSSWPLSGCGLRFPSAPAPQSPWLGDPAYARHPASAR